ncbi:MAG: hypothetical protein ACJ74Z_16110 [Bryobacteraceae bacterium]|jgi:hypothetical protein
MQKTTVETNGTAKPATVELKALMIDGKQMTLSVFRQLQREELIEYYSGQLLGVPWGWVNYPPGDCADDKLHIHAVWQKGSELRRACVDHEPRLPPLLGKQRTWLDRRLLAQSVLDGRITELTRDMHLLLLSHETLGPLVFSYLSDQKKLRDCLHYKRERDPRFSLGQLEKQAERHERNMWESREALKEHTDKHPFDQGSSDEIEQAIAKFENNWHESYAAITSKGQIFIAV